MAAIEHVALFADDPDALRRFYEEAFGLRTIVDNGAASPPGYFLADDRGTALEIIGRPPSAPTADPRYICHVAFLVDDVAARRAALEGRGLQFEPDTAVSSEAMTTAFFRDPEGNRVQIVWRPRPLGS